MGICEWMKQEKREEQIKTKERQRQRKRGRIFYEKVLGCKMCVLALTKWRKKQRDRDIQKLSEMKMRGDFWVRGRDRKRQNSDDQVFVSW